jgi:hypothetical protein
VSDELDKLHISDIYLAPKRNDEKAEKQDYGIEK